MDPSRMVPLHKLETDANGKPFCKACEIMVGGVVCRPGAFERRWIFLFGVVVGIVAWSVIGVVLWFLFWR